MTTRSRYLERLQALEMFWLVADRRQTFIDAFQHHILCGSRASAQHDIENWFNFAYRVSSWKADREGLSEDVRDFSRALAVADVRDEETRYIILDEQYAAARLAVLKEMALDGARKAG